MPAPVASCAAARPAASAAAPVKSALCGSPVTAAAPSAAVSRQRRTLCRNACTRVTYPALPPWPSLSSTACGQSSVRSANRCSIIEFGPQP